MTLHVCAAARTGSVWGGLLHIASSGIANEQIPDVYVAPRGVGETIFSAPVERRFDVLRVIGSLKACKSDAGINLESSLTIIKDQGIWETIEWRLGANADG